MWRATLRSLWAHKLRMAATGLAVLLGVAFTAGTLVLTDTVKRTFEDLFASVNEGTAAFVRGADPVEGGFGEQRARLDAALVEQVRAVDGVEAAEGLIQGYAQIVGRDGEPIGDPNMGAPTFGMSWPEVEEFNPMRIRDGRPPEGDGEVVIDRGSAKEGDLEVGDRTSVLTKVGPTAVTIVGIATFGSVDSPGGASIALFDVETAQRLVGEPGRYDSISTVAEPGVTQEVLRDRIDAALPDSAEVLTGTEITEENQSDIEEGLTFFTAFLLTFAGVALFVGSFIIHNTFSIVVAQRSRELALLRAIGASRRQVLASVLGEAVAVGVFSSVAGILAGVAVAAGLKALLAGFGVDVPAGGIVFLPRTAIVCLVIGVGVTLFATVLPARRASRIPPIAALRDLALDTSGRSRRRLVMGLVVVAAGGGVMALGLANQEIGAVGLGGMLLFVGIAVLGPVFAGPVVRLIGWPLPRTRGVTGRLARENAMRNPRRTAATASALMIGVALVGFITIAASTAKASLEETVDEVFLGDLVIDSGSFGGGSGLSPDLARRIADVEGVADVLPIRAGPVEIEGDGTFLTATDPRSIERIVELGVRAGRIEDLVEDTTIALHDDTAADLGVGVGDTVTARFADTGVTELRVVAVYGESQLIGDHLVGFATWEPNVADQVDLVVLITVEDGADVDATRAAVEEITGTYPGAELEDRTEFKESQAAMIDQLLNIIYALLFLAILIALIGIANTLALSVFERTRELGLLRAVGMTRGQLRSAVRWESVMIAVFGALLGVAIAVSFSAAVVFATSDDGAGNLTIPVTQLVVIVVLAALAGVLAAILPARRAAKLDVLRAITVE